MPTLIAFWSKSDEPGILQKHEPNSAAFYYVNTWNPRNNQTWSYVGKDCLLKLIIDLNKLAQAFIKEMLKQTEYDKYATRTNSI